MSKTDQRFRDAFTFNLRGAMTIGSFAAMPVMAHNRINKMLDTRFRQINDGHGNRHATFKRCA